MNVTKLSDFWKTPDEAMNDLGRLRFGQSWTTSTVWS